MKKLDYYYWGNQCPINNETLSLLKNYDTQIEVHVHDISENPALAKLMRIFFPFLTVFNEKKRWFGPLNKVTIEKFLRDEPLNEVPYVKTWGTEMCCGELQVLNADSIHLVANGCTLTNCLFSCEKKHDFLSTLTEEPYGYLHLLKDEVVGGVEWLPSMNVPYDVPKDEKTAFLTCLYSSNEIFDYKSYPLNQLEETLLNRYDSILAVTDEIGSFPNGDLALFLRLGYEDLGVISEEEGYCRLHLVKKSLSPKL